MDHAMLLHTCGVAYVCNWWVWLLWPRPNKILLYDNVIKIKSEQGKLKIL